MTEVVFGKVGFKVVVKKEKPIEVYAEVKKQLLAARSILVDEAGMEAIEELFGPHLNN